MRQKYLLLLLVISQLAFAQKKQYYNKQGDAVSKEKADYYKVLSKTDNKLWKIQEFYISGTQKYEGHSMKKDGSEKVGTHYSYYPSGIVKNKAFFVNKKLSNYESYFKSSNIKKQSVYDNTGLPESDLFYYDSGQLKIEMYSSGPQNKRKILVKVYYENGNLKREDEYLRQNNKESYTNYELVSGLLLSEEGNEISHTPFFRVPKFPGGSNMLATYIKNNFKYPKEALKYKFNGKTVVNFVINKKGKIGKVKIKKSVNWRLDDEVIRVIENMPNWIPGIMYGKPSKFNFSLPLTLKK